MGNSDIQNILNFIESVRKIEHVASCDVNGSADNGNLSIKVSLDATERKFEAKGKEAVAYMPEDGQRFDIRKVTNPIRRHGRKAGLTAITTPTRLYTSRTSCVNEFEGLSSPYIHLELAV